MNTKYLIIAFVALGGLYLATRNKSSKQEAPMAFEPLISDREIAVSLSEVPDTPEFFAKRIVDTLSDLRAQTRVLSEAKDKGVLEQSKRAYETLTGRTMRQDVFNTASSMRQNLVLSQYF